MPDPTESWGVEGARPDPALANSVTIEDIRGAASRIAGLASRTPALRFSRLDERGGASFVLKCENLQPIGAFKVRGAANAMRRLDAGVRGVITFSSGNHAQAIAYTAARLKIPAVIIMPGNAPRVKLESTRALLAHAPAGSEVVVYDPEKQSREALGRSLAEERGLVLVPPYDHPDVIAGQGTAALELLTDAPDLDELFVCCGGGGLLSGCAVATKAIRPACRVVGVEPAPGDDATRSFNSGRLCVVRNPPTIADGARTPYLGRYTFPLVRTHVDAMMTVTEPELARATLFALDVLKLVVEPSGALALAGALRAAGPGARVGVIVSGGNLDLDTIPELRRLGETGTP